MINHAKATAAAVKRPLIEEAIISIIRFKRDMEMIVLGTSIRMKWRYWRVKAE